METEKLMITIEDWLQLGYEGKIQFLCACGCGKKFEIDVLDWKPVTQINVKNKVS